MAEDTKTAGGATPPSSGNTTLAAQPNKRSKLSPHKRVWLLIAGSIVVLAVIAVVTVMLIHPSNVPDSQNSKGGVTPANASTLDSINQHAQELEYKNNDLAEHYLKQELATTSDKQLQAQLYGQLIFVASNESPLDNHKVLDYAMKEDALQPTAGSAKAVALAYVGLGDKTDAKLYAQKAIARLNKNDPAYNQVLRLYQQSLSEALNG